MRGGRGERVHVMGAAVCASAFKPLMLPKGAWAVRGAAPHLRASTGVGGCLAGRDAGGTLSR